MSAQIKTNMSKKYTPHKLTFSLQCSNGSQLFAFNLLKRQLTSAYVGSLCNAS